MIEARIAAERVREETPEALTGVSRAGDASAPPPLIPGYEIVRELARDDWQVLYRGLRRSDRHPVLLKLPRGRPVLASDVTLLERECSLLRELSLTGVVRVHQFLRHADHCVLILEDHSAAPLHTLLDARALPLARFFKLALQLAGVLGELHRRDVIHSNISPQSILLNPDSDEVWLSDFHLASRASSDATAPPQRLRAALAHMSPEQTGRMNRATDYRTDFYSLGITYYQLLTGQLPFFSDDALELIHWHIARTPRPPAARNSEIPGPLSDVVMKLLAKTPEERYQSAVGLKEDLELCAREWTAAGQITPFRLGLRDVSDRFVIPQKLYGRESQVAELLGTFNHVCQGDTAMLLVGGYSGIGKTALVQELCGPIVRQRGYFVSGKFDQVARSEPFGALIRAFRALCRQLVSESEAQLGQWRERLLAVLGANGAVLAEVIPELEWVIGKQPAAPAVGPAEALNRFQLVLQNFVGALARKEHPLAIFLDDLQWADPATLSLLQPLLTSPSIRYFFLIGAYRDNEVDAAHPLTRTLRELESAGVALRRVSLQPLPSADLTRLLCDVLHGDEAHAMPLVELVWRKTHGNPFFVIQFLKALEHDGFLAFDHAHGRFSYELDNIVSAATTDNVIDLMTCKLQELSPNTQRALTLAACIGNSFDRETLAIVSEQPVESVSRDLQQAITVGLILPATRPYQRADEPGAETAPITTTYAFLHDRMQQAAYELIPADRKQSVHLTLGRLLLASGDPTEVDARVFDIVQHLNLGSNLITDSAERTALARLNLKAGHKAKASTAYEAARDYLRAGTSLLPEHVWNSDYELALALHLEAAECHNLCGDFDEAEQEIALLLRRARAGIDKAQAYRLRIVQHENLSHYTEALTSGFEGLGLFGLSFPPASADKQAALESELSTIQSLLAGRSIGALIELPLMTDPGMHMVMSILTTIWSSAYISGDPILTGLISATLVRLSLVHGNSEESAYGYATHAITAGPQREDYEAAYEWGRLALAVNERFNDATRRAKICQQFQAHACLWRQPFRTCIAYAREARRVGFENGDFTYAIYGAYTATWSAMLIAQNLGDFVREYSPNLSLFEKLKASSVGDAQKILLNWAQALMGQTHAPTSLSDAGFDEDRYLDTYRDNPFFRICYAVAKLQLCYLFGDYPRALEIAHLGREIVHQLTGTIWPVVFDFWNGLTLAANYELVDGAAQAAFAVDMERARASLALLAENCPENYRCMSLLLNAEIERVSGRKLAALDGYERAVQYAQEIGAVQHQALANELSAGIWSARGQTRIAAVFMAEAKACYARWGASAKVTALEGNLPAASAEQPSSSQSPPPIAAHHASAVVASEQVEVGAFDLFSVMKAAQAIAVEIELEQLLAKLMRIAIENAGAERGSLALEHDGESFIHAVGSLDTAVVKLRDATALVDAELSIPVKVVNYVRRTLESVVLADARRDERYANDPYVIAHVPRSLMCIPVLNQARLVGVLYLENNMASGAFTEDRIRVCQLLASQAAISLENARLYDGMKAEIAHRGRAELDLRTALSEVESLKNRLHAENAYLQDEIRHEHNFEEMVGNSPALMKVLRDVDMVAVTDSTVLITGETGTGKELIARAVHNRSARRNRPLVKVNCGAISAGLVESELFGHVKGAFTGAIDRRSGRFELADGGTVFLDEVGELPLDTQVKLLRVLQEGEFEPVGSSKSTKVNVRIIAATNRDLEEAVRNGRFRADLFYRLNVFPLQVPALRERRSDVPQLVSFFLARFAKKFGKPIEDVSRDTMQWLVNYAWPGNIRELQNVIERAVVVCQSSLLSLGQDLLGSPGGGHSATLEMAPSGLASPQTSGPRPAVRVTGPAQATLQEVARSHILAVLKQTGGVIEGPKGAAMVLNVHPNTLRSRMKKLGIRHRTGTVDS